MYQFTYGENHKNEQTNDFPYQPSAINCVGGNIAGILRIRQFPHYCRHLFRWFDLCWANAHADTLLRLSLNESDYLCSQNG